MYGRRALGLGSVSGGAASVVGGIIVLPNTSNNVYLAVLSIATITIGLAVLVSFLTSRAIAAYQK
jgi:hypothetical protein